MRAPSLAALRATFPELTVPNAELIRDIAHNVDEPDTLADLIEKNVPATEAYVRSLYSCPYGSRIWRVTVALHAMNVLLEMHGVEALGPVRDGDYTPQYEYLNTGDQYLTTLIYSRNSHNVFLGCAGDIAERF